MQPVFQHGECCRKQAEAYTEGRHHLGQAASVDLRQHASKSGLSQQRSTIRLTVDIEYMMFVAE
jgi:hypothetical protein